MATPNSPANQLSILDAPPIQIRNLVKSYGPNRAVNDISLEMKTGEIFGLLGPNGAGKTTLISTLVTLEAPTSGTVSIFGLDVTKEPERVKMLTGFVPQELIHHGFFDVEEIMQFHSGYFGRRKNQERIDWLLQKLSLWDHRKKKVKQLSGGMKRRLLIAKALVHEPKLLLLDEPTAGVDIALRESLWIFVDELKKAGMSILLTTHYIQEAEQLCDRIGVIQKGQLRRLGPTRDLIKELTKRQIVIQLKNPPAQNPNHPAFLRSNGNEWIFQVPAQVGAGELLASLHLDLNNVNDLTIREGSLEDALKLVLEPAKGETPQ